MSLKAKTLIILLFITLFVLGVYYVTNGMVLLPTINKLEEERARINVERVISTIEETTISLSQTVADYATWDDTYEYIEDQNDEYRDSNLDASTLANLKVHFMVFIRQDGNIVYSKLVSGDSWEEITFPSSLTQAIFSYPSLTRHEAPEERTEGVAITPFGPAYVASHPITTSSDEGPVRGTLVMGRFIDEFEKERLMQLTKLSFTVVLPQSFTQQHLSAVTSETGVHTMQGARERIVALGLVRDLLNEPAFVVEADLPREFFQHGRQAQLLSTGLLAVLAGISVVILYILFSHIVLGKLLMLTKDLEQIAQKGNFSLRVATGGNDEVARIGHTVNTFLSIIGKYQQSSEEKTKELAQQVESTSRQNVSLENTKKAMLNLLEDARGLEGQLRRERDRAQGIITSMTEGLFVVDTNYVLQLMNPMASKMLNLDPKKTVGKDVTGFVKLLKDGIEMPREERPLWQTLTKGIPVKGDVDEKYIIKTEHIEIPIAFATAALTTDGKTIGALVTFHDVSHELQEKEIIENTVEERTRELREKNEALARAQQEISHGWMQVQREKARLTASINSLQLGFILTDQSEGIFMINGAAMKILGLKAQVYHISELESLVGGAIAIHSMLSECASKKESVSKRDIFFKNIYINITITPVLLEGTEREFLGTVITIEDITEAKVTQRARDEFFSIASHELRTPLTAIRGNTSMINEFFGDTLREKKELKEMIDDIYSSSVRLIQIVNDFLNVSRLEMGKIEFKKESLDIMSLIENATKELHGAADEKHISLSIEPPPSGLSKVVGDSDRVKEVLINLIGNSIKYTERGGVTVNVRQDSGRVKVLIRDTGAGIPKENWDLLFRKFQQAGNSLLTRDTKRSTGLGLYIAKLMVEGMGGSIYLESSEVGKGSTFAFTLPASQ